MTNICKFIGLFGLLILSSISVSAYDFLESGLYFNILSEDEGLVEVTCEYEGLGHGSDSPLFSADNVIIPEKITHAGKTYTVYNIGYRAFFNCTNLKSVIIPPSVTSIGYGAFQESENLLHVNIPESVISIGDYAFSRCFNLESIYIPELVENIGECAFLCCNRLTEIPVSEANRNYASVDGVLYTKDISTLIQYPSSKNDAIFNIPSTVARIESMAFNACSNLTTVNIPASVSYLGQIWCIFTECSKLENLNVNANNQYYKSIDGILYSKDNATLIRCPEAKNYGNYVINNDVNIIGIGAFNGCKNLSSITIPNSVELIDHYVFMECNNLTTVNFPSSDIIVGNYMFHSCSGLTEIIIPKNIIFLWSCRGTFTYCNNLEEVIIESPIESVGESMFSQCEKLKKVVLPNTVKSIEGAAFNNCNSLTYFAIPNTVVSLGNQVFRWCSSLSYLEIPESVQTIGEHCFIDCDNLKTIMYKTKEPIISPNNIFDNHIYQNATLFVEIGGLENARITTPWMYFKNIQENDFSGIEEVIADFDANTPIEVYNLNGVRVTDRTNNLPAGLYIIRHGNISKKVTVK